MKNVRGWWYAHLVFWPTWLWNILLGRVLKVRAWWNEIDPAVFLGARPFRSDIPRLKAAGVKNIVNTCEEFPGFVTDYQRAGIDQLYVPTVDFTHPSRSSIDEAVQYIDEAVAAGNKVYIHARPGGPERDRRHLLFDALSRHDAGASPAASASLSAARQLALVDRPVVQQYAADLQGKRSKEPRWAGKNVRVIRGLVAEPPLRAGTAKGLPPRARPRRREACSRWPGEISANAPAFPGRTVRRAGATTLGLGRAWSLGALGLGVPATVDVDRLPGHVRSEIAAEEQDHIAISFRLAEPAERDIGQHDLAIFLGMDWPISVLITPGATALTRMLRRASSLLRTFVSVHDAGLCRSVVGLAKKPIAADSEATLTIAPPSRSFSALPGKR